MHSGTGGVGGPTGNPNCELIQSKLRLEFTNENGICIPVDVSLTKAILRYKGAPAVDPVTNSTPGLKMNDADMHVSDFRVYPF